MVILPTPAGWPKVTLARAGAYDPDGPLAAAEEAGAWAAWKRVAGRTSPDELIREVTAAGLRGRGGAGFPAGEKWRICRGAEAGQRYVVANGCEADPGAFTDRLLMEADPHAVVEGLALAACAVGATRAIVAVNAGYREAAARLRRAIAGAEEAGHLGTGARDGLLDLHVEVREVAGAFTLGEETALLRSLEGKRAMPDQRPPYPATRGLFGQPTLVHNVETLAAVRWIATNGAAAFAAIGSPGNAGTKLVQLSGAVTRPGVAEVPLGTSLRELVEGLGGGVAGGGAFKAALVGGPTGGLLPAASLDLPLTFEALAGAGAIMGSGSIVVADESTCVVDLGRLLERYCAEEACGKSIPCRIGLRRLVEIADRFADGRRRPGDPQLLADLAADVIDSGLCNHERLAPGPLLTGMRYFGDEYDAHALEGRCPAGVCRPLTVAAATAR